MIASQNPEAPRIDGQAFGKAELHRKIGYPQVAVSLVRVIAPEPGVAGFQIRFEAARSSIHLCEKRFILRGVVQPLLRDASQHSDGVVVRRFPQIAIEALKEFYRLRVPGPSYIECKHVKITQ